MEEVHLWRGSTQQRRLRSQASRSGQFSYFNQQLDYPDWSRKVVLDFGGNKGNLLLDPACTIRREDYYCLDVLEEARKEGLRSFPEAHWFHYNRYNCSFNPNGVVGLPIPEMGANFDIILSYSVFTHTTPEEMNDLVEQLLARLAPLGTLAFTFIDPHWTPWPENYEGDNLKWRLEKARETNPSVDVNRLWEQSRDAAWCALVNGTELYVNDKGVWTNEAETCMTYNLYYSAEFIQREFPRATILSPVNGEMQHCCIIRREM